MVRDLGAGSTRIYLELEYRRVAYPHCKAVSCWRCPKLCQEGRGWLVDNFGIVITS
ncbi:MAG: hypothetical protein COX51_02675 [Syntrophobacteraceae bacterium CG23_combo_of_CG06-09_8_20_14_all_50_8]|nr:MAG: hypothetical protein COX51_02675 [Syntrophobacteraceae bacterium CG23_combo_of_CG06-09_8_20_14_all_50_8]